MTTTTNLSNKRAPIISLSNLTIRILVAVPAAVLFIYSAWLGGWFFYALILSVTLFMQHEMLNIAKQTGFKPNKIIVYLATLWIFTYNLLPEPVLWGGILFLGLCIAETLNNNHIQLVSIVSTPFYSLFVPLGMYSIIELRQLGNDPTGFTFTILLFLLIWGNDVFAYFGGKNFGKRALSPELSPNKTVEGFLFGFLGGLTGTILLYLFLPFNLTFSFYFLLPTVILSGLFGPAGDLLESKMKRIAKIKDSSSVIPGHGGFLDRFDAILLTAPVLLIYFKLLDYTGFITI